MPIYGVAVALTTVVIVTCQLNAAVDNLFVAGGGVWCRGGGITWKKSLTYDLTTLNKLIINNTSSVRHFVAATYTAYEMSMERTGSWLLRMGRRRECRQHLSAE